MGRREVEMFFLGLFNFIRCCFLIFFLVFVCVFRMVREKK